jgi:hypothetical protein
MYTLFILLAGSVGLAQSATGEVNGTVLDPTGAVVAGARVTLTNQGTKISGSAASNANGYFIFINLQPGVYVLTVERDGFKKLATAPFELAVNQTITQPMHLAVGATAETVEVRAEAPLLQLASSELGTVIPQRAVNDLPLNGRNFTQLLTLTPGATPVSTAQGSGISFQDAAISGIPNSSFSKPSVQGQPNRSTLYYLDGFINTDLRGPVYGVLPIIDTIEEFKVQSHNDKVEYGGAMGGVVSVVSKSGTNEFHGSAWEFVRNNAFDARNPFTDVSLVNGVTTPHGPAPFRQNEFGAAGGGPIFKNRTFFYVGYEGWRYSKPTQDTAYIPTAAELNGDFTNTKNTAQIYNPYSTFTSGGKVFRNPFLCDATGNPLPVNAANVQTGVGTPCSKIPAALISPVMQAYLKAYLLPPNAQLANGDNLIEFRPQIDNADTWTARLDHHASETDSVYFRFTQMLVHHLDHVRGTNEDQPSNYHANNFGGGWVHSFRSNLILDVTGGALRKPFVFNQALSSAGTAPMNQLGLNVNQFNGMTVTLDNTPWTKLEVGNRGDSIRRNPDWSAGSNLDWIKGNHDFRFGGQYVWVARDQINTFQTFGFGSAITSCPGATSATKCPANGATSIGGLSLAGALLGLPTGGSGELPDVGEVNLSLASWSLYGSDQWKILPKLTVNLGLRWDFLTQPTVHNGRLSNGLDLFGQRWLIGATQLPAACSTVGNANGCIPDTFFTPCPSPQTKPPTPCNSLIAVNGHVIPSGSQNFMSPPVYNNYGPRVGFAWQALNKTVIRGGVGLFWDTLSARSQYAQNDLEGQRWPWSSGFSLNNPNANNLTPSQLQQITAFAGGTSVVIPPNPWGQTGNPNDPNWQNPWSMQYNLEIQRELASSTIVSVAYVGSRDGHLPYAGKANALPQPLSTIPAGTCVQSVGQANPGQPDPTENCLKAVPWMSSGITYNTSRGYSRYNALQAKFQRNFTRGLMSLVSYTWSKALDNTSGFFGVENGAGQGGSAVENFYNPTGNYGPTGYDIPHFLSWYTVYELPFGRGKRWLQKGPFSWFLGNWQSNYIFQTRSGQPFNLNVNGDPAAISGDPAFGSVNSYSRPNLIADPYQAGPIAANPNPLCQKTISQGGLAADQTQTAQSWFNPCSFASPVGTFGNFGRNGLRSAHVTNLDFSLTKSISVAEGKTLQLRFEAFNVLNIQNLAAPTGNATNINLVPSNVGVLGGISSIVGNPRQLQFGARFTF